VLGVAMVYDDDDDDDDWTRFYIPEKKTTAYTTC
jgi:hypothetical protein